MKHSRLSISLPASYVTSLDRASSQYAISRSEFVRVLIDCYQKAIDTTTRKTTTIDHHAVLDDMFAHLPHGEREKAKEWMVEYLRLITRIHEEAISSGRITQKPSGIETSTL